MSKPFNERADKILLRIAAVCTIGTLVATVALLYWTVFVGVGPIRDDIRSIQERGLLRITSPRSGATVAMDVAVHGLSFATDRRVYLIVTGPLGTSHVQNGEVMVTSSGLWSAHARLGEAGAGAGQTFHIRAVATDRSLAEGPLLEVSSDSVFSDPIVVVRSK